MKLTANGRRRLQLLTTILLVVTIVAIIYTLVAWILSEPGSFEPLNVLFFAVMSLLTAVSAWLGRAEHVAPPESSTVAEAETIPLGPLRQQIVDCFDLDELRTLCLDIGILYDDLDGGTISAKTASLLAYMQRRGQLGKLTAVLQRERPHVTWFLPAQLEQQYGLRRNVRAAWIDGVLKQSVTEEIALELKLTYQPQALARQTLYVLGQVDRPVEKEVPTLFAESGSLLILGEPGSGKTMTLLQLAERLLDAAEADPAQPTPVVLNLSSWAMQQGALPDWMVEELLLQYQLPRETSRRFIASGGLIYLLDGLDEVAAEARDACVQAINELKAQQPAPLVVCCRVVEYEGLAEKLNLGTAVRIQPLTDEQIDDYLRRPELKLTAVRQMVKTDAAMRELAQTPLFLSVMTLAYRDMKRADLKQLPTPETRRAHLYRHYVAEMWRRRPLKHRTGFDETQALTWLTNLAVGLQKHENMVFYIERLQPTWLNTNRSRLGHLVMVGLGVGLIAGLGSGLGVGLVFGPRIGLIGGVLVGLGGGLFFGMRTYLYPIQLMEDIVWGLSAKKMLRSMTAWLIFGLGIGLAFGVAGGLEVGLITGSCFALAGWIEAGIQSKDSIQSHSPNQGIRNSFRNSVGFGMFYGFVFACVGAYTARDDKSVIAGLMGGMICGMGFGFLVYGGISVIQHFTLRWCLERQGILLFPFRNRKLVAYLDAMADRILLRRVGGGWVFIHRTLLDYFASLHPDAAPATPVILNPAGVKNPAE